MTDKNLTDLFETYQFSEHPPIVELLNKNQETVGAVYLDKIKPEQVVISETTHSEKYCLYVHGVLIYFSYFKKISN